MTRECRPSQCLYLLLVRAGKGLLLVLLCFEKDGANYRKTQISVGWGRFGAPGASSDSSQARAHPQLHPSGPPQEQPWRLIPQSFDGATLELWMPSAPLGRKQNVFG